MAMDVRQALGGVASYLLRQGAQYLIQNGNKPRPTPERPAVAPPRETPTTSPIHNIGCPYGYAADHLTLAQHHLELARQHPDAATIHLEMAAAYIYEAPARLSRLGNDNRQALDLELDLMEIYRLVLTQPAAPTLGATLDGLGRQCTQLCHQLSAKPHGQAIADDPVAIIRDRREGKVTREEAIDRLRRLVEETGPEIEGRVKPGG